MTDGPLSPVRPVPRWVRAAAVTNVVLATVLLALGGFVTSFRVGMADKVWPTEPWYLLDKDWSSLEFGFLVEHTHRLAGWIVGLATTVVAFAAWRYAPRGALKWVGLASMFGLLVTYGEFHRGMGKVWNEIKQRAESEYNLKPKDADFEAKLGGTHLIDGVTAWPVGSGVASAVLAAVVLMAGAAAAGTPGGWVRAAAGWALVFVMAQGLLGGFRVLLHAIMGPNLAAVHGMFGQVAFVVIVAVAVFAARRREADALPEKVRGGFVKLSWALVAVLLVQLGWAVMLRHTGTALSQRLHIITAFLATGLVVWLAAKLVGTPEARPLKGQGFHLIGILAVQLLLGAEAYIGKFAATGPYMTMLPELRPVTAAQAGIRTAHQLVGAGLLASAVAVALRAGRRPVGEAVEVRTRSIPEPTRVPAAVS